MHTTNNKYHQEILEAVIPGIDKLKSPKGSSLSALQYNQLPQNDKHSSLQLQSLKHTCMQ